jgi:AcrR family transcriptional regulator
MVVNARRIGSEDSATRTALVDAAQELMVEEGYAAVTSRKVAARAGLKPQLVHYYFRTMDDLFLAVVRRGAEHNLERQARALASEQPLRALWAFSADPAGAKLQMELIALGNHRKVVRDELAGYAQRFRELQREALTAVFERNQLVNDVVSPDAVLVLLTAVSRVLTMEEAIGLTAGHDEVRALVEGYLTKFEGASPSN